MSKNIYLTALHDRNEVLFFRLLSENLREMIPIVNDRTVGLAMQQYHHEARRPRGVYLSIDHADEIEEALGNLGAGPNDIDLILATDAEQIFGIGDWGVGGIEISIGKLAIYTAAGGIDPTRVIPVMLDVGTNRESLLVDPMYPGKTGTPGSVETATTPSSTPTSRPSRKRFRKPCCNGKTSGPAMRAASWRNIAARSPPSVTICKAPAPSRWRPPFPLCASVGMLLRNQRVIIFGAGIAGIGIADLIRDVMIHEGLPAEEATRRFSGWWMCTGRWTQRHGRQVARLSGRLYPPRHRRSKPGGPWYLGWRAPSPESA